MVIFDFLQSLSMETRDLIYDAIGIVNWIAAIIGNIFYGKKFGLSWRKSILFTFVVQILIFVIISYYIRKLEVILFGRGNFSAFRTILLVPLAAIPLSRLTNTDFKLICDYFAPIYYLRHGISTIGCIFAGCCGGKEWSWGFISPQTNTIVFPLQLFIIAFSTLIGIFCLWHNKKHNYHAGSRTFAYALILYGLFRFVAEFISDSNRLFWGMSLYSIYSLLMIIVGTLMLIRARKAWGR